MLQCAPLARYVKRGPLALPSWLVLTHSRTTVVVGVLLQVLALASKQPVPYYRPSQSNSQELIDSLADLRPQNRRKKKAHARTPTAPANGLATDPAPLKHLTRALGRNNDAEVVARATALAEAAAGANGVTPDTTGSNTTRWLKFVGTTAGRKGITPEPRGAPVPRRGRGAHASTRRTGLGAKTKRRRHKHRRRRDGGGRHAASLPAL